MSILNEDTEEGLDALSDDEWELVGEMADDYERQFGDDLQALYEGYYAEEDDDE